MLLRLAFAAWAGIALLHGQPVPPRTLADADRIEAGVEASPDDIAARLMLLRYYWNPGNNAPAGRIEAALRSHAVWIVEHHPDHPALRERWAAILPVGRRGDAEAYQAADRAWRKHLAEPSPAAAVYANAATFYKFTDPAFARKIAAEGRAAWPADSTLGAAAGMLHALAILHARAEDDFGSVTQLDDSAADDDRARESLRLLEETSDAAVLGGAGYYLQRQLFALTRAGQRARAEEDARLAEQYLKRAGELDGGRNPQWRAGLSMLYSYRASLAADPRQKIAWLEKAAAASDELTRISSQDALARGYLEAGDFAKAAQIARDLLALAAKQPDNWAYGNAIHNGNIVLGRVALHEGNNAEATRRLLVAGGTKGSPQLNSFGPDWTLAAELLANGERDAVLSYIDLCGTFWTLGKARLEAWGAAIRAGAVVDFRSPVVAAKPLPVGRAAPALRLPKLQGGELSLEQFAGKIVLLDFWATWCGPCREEMPVFEKLHQELGPEVAILAVDVGETEDVVAAYMARERYTFPVLLAEHAETVAAYAVNAYPTLVAVDAAGKVAEYAVGRRGEAELRQAIARARAGASAPAARLPAPRQLSPAAGALFDHFPRVTTLVWSEVPGASGYAVEWDYRDNGGWHMEQPNGIAGAVRVTEPVATIRFVGAQPGRWRVMALDASGNAGEVSGWREFSYTR